MVAITGTVRINNVEYTPQTAVEILNSSGFLSGGKQFDSFAGTTDDDKLTSVLQYLAQTSTSRRPPIIMPPRDRTFNVKGRVPLDGMRFLEPIPLMGPKNPELEGSRYVPWMTNVNSSTGGANAWWNGGAAGDVYNVYFGGMVIKYAAGGQFWSQTAGTLYACKFEEMTHYGSTGVFGNDNEKCLMTQVVLDGHWQANTMKGAFMNPGGSDNSYFTSGLLNLGGAAGGAGRYLIKSDTNTKTEWGKIYNTAHNGWRPLLLTGNGQNAFYGGQFEGMNRNTPSEGNLIKVTGGTAVFHDAWLAYGMANPTAAEQALIQVEGGANVTFYSPVIDRGAMNQDVPSFQVSGAGSRLKLVDVRRHAITKSTDSWTAAPVAKAINGGKLIVDTELVNGSWVPENVRVV